MIGSKTSVAKYASGWVASHPGETRCDWEMVYRSHAEAIEFATNHALACLHTLERRREENRRLIAQAADVPDWMLGPSAHRDVVISPSLPRGTRMVGDFDQYRGGGFVAPLPEPADDFGFLPDSTVTIDVPWSEIVQPNGPVRYDAPDLGTRLRRAAIERLRNARLSVAR